MSFSGRSQRGAILLESAIIIPVLILLLFGALGIIELFYTKSVVTFALQEGIRLAQKDDRLKVDLARLNPNVAEDRAKINEFIAAREAIVARTAALISKASGPSLQLIPLNINDSKVPGTSMPLAFLPPTFSAIPTTRTNMGQIRHEICDPLMETKSDGSVLPVLGACVRDDSYQALLQNSETEFHAAVRMKGLFMQGVTRDMAVRAPLFTSVGGGNNQTINNNLNGLTPQIVTFRSEYHRLMTNSEFRAWYSTFTNGNTSIKPAGAAWRNDEGWNQDPQTLNKLCEFFMDGTWVKHTAYRNRSDNNNFWTYWDRNASAWKVIYSSFIDDSDVNTITCLGMKGIVRGASLELLPHQPTHGSRVSSHYRG